MSKDLDMAKQALIEELKKKKMCLPCGWNTGWGMEKRQGAH